MRSKRYWMAASLAVGLAACNNALTSDNNNDPDALRVTGRPTDNESFIASQYLVQHQGTIGGSGADGLYTQLSSFALETGSTLANFAMGVRVAIPRVPLQNDRGNANNGGAGNIRDWRVLSRAAYASALGFVQFNRPNYTTGSPGRDARARAFALFVNGISVGQLAMAYDSVGIATPSNVLQLTPEVLGTTPPPLAGYRTAADSAISLLTQAITIAQADGSGFPLPASWMNGQPLNRDQFVALVRGWRARISAGIARNQAERVSRPWTAQIIPDALAFGTQSYALNASANAARSNTEDFALRFDSTVQPTWDFGWFAATLMYRDATWHQMPMSLIGFCDSTGGYQAWLSTPIGSRTPFTMTCVDTRFPQGATRGAQQGDTSTVRYFRNRPTAQDIGTNGLTVSQYDYIRSRAFGLNQRIGLWPVMTRPEMDLLAAEGYIYTGQSALAVPLINKTRTARGGLPAIPVGIAAPTGPNWSTTGGLVPSDANGVCVPRVPVTSGSVVTCGNLYEAMKWEKRLETAFTFWGSWFFDSRAWNDLPAGTPTQWPVPWQESDSRKIPFYSVGGLGGLYAVPAPSTYRFEGP